jgi:hypothetical protein
MAGTTPPIGEGRKALTQFDFGALRRRKKSQFFEKNP